MLALMQQDRRRIIAFAAFGADPGGAGTFTLPPWLAIACATTGRTAQVSATAVRAGFGANAARARSLDGGHFGLSVESARTNLLLAPNDVSDAAWTKFTGVTAPGQVSLPLDPAGGTNASRIDYDGSGTVDSVLYYEETESTPTPGVAYTTTGWFRRSTGTSTVRVADNLGPFGADCAISATAWAKAQVTDVAGNQAVFAFFCQGAGVNAAETIYGWGHQQEVGLYPTSFVSGARAADKLSIASPATVAPGGFFDLRLHVAPNYATAEQATDHNLFYLDANNRVYLQQSTGKVVLRIGGANVLSSALTWSREQELSIRAAHTASGRTLTIAGATTGNGTATGGAAGAITLPGTAYVLGSNTGAEESSDLRYLAFHRMT